MLCIIYCISSKTTWNQSMCFHNPSKGFTLTALPSQYLLIFSLSLTNTETAVATPWEQLRNLWWASAQWKLVATHFFWWISPPICFETCLQPKRITEVHHKVSKNALKVKGWLTNCLKFGKPVIWICFEVKSDFFSLETSIWTSHWDCLKFGKTFTWICLEVKSYFFRIRN